MVGGGGGSAETAVDPPCTPCAFYPPRGEGGGGEINLSYVYLPSKTNVESIPA